MGLRGYLRRRRERESALSRLELDPVRDGSVEAPDERGSLEVPARPGSVEAPNEGRGAPGTGGQGGEPAGEAAASEPEPVELPGADPAELAAMLGRALAGGTPQVSTGSHRIEGQGIAEEIVALLAEVGSPAGEQGVAVAPEDAEQLLERVRARLAELEREGGDPPTS